MVGAKGGRESTAQGKGTRTLSKQDSVPRNGSMGLQQDPWGWVGRTGLDANKNAPMSPTDRPRGGALPRTSDSSMCQGGHPCLSAMRVAGWVGVWYQKSVLTQGSCPNPET